jgi:hypothetical protein
MKNWNLYKMVNRTSGFFVKEIQPPPMKDHKPYLPLPTNSFLRKKEPPPQPVMFF